MFLDLRNNQKSSGSSLYECSTNYSTLKRSFAPRILTTTSAAHLNVHRVFSFLPIIQSSSENPGQPLPGAQRNKSLFLYYFFADSRLNHYITLYQRPIYNVLPICSNREERGSLKRTKTINRESQKNSTHVSLGAENMLNTQSDQSYSFRGSWNASDARCPKALWNIEH
jgi:hypothetical protein